MGASAITAAVFWPLTKIPAVQRALHQHTIIPWSDVEQIEMKKRKLHFTIYGTKGAITISIKRGQEAVAEDRFSKAFGAKFIRRE